MKHIFLKSFLKLSNINLFWFQSTFFFWPKWLLPKFSKNTRKLYVKCKVEKNIFDSASWKVAGLLHFYYWNHANSSKAGSLIRFSTEKVKRKCGNEVFWASKMHKVTKTDKINSSKLYFILNSFNSKQKVTSKFLFTLEFTFIHSLTVDNVSYTNRKQTSRAWCQNESCHESENSS